MIQSLLLVVIVAAIVYLIKYASKLPPAQRKSFLLKYALYAIALIALLLLVTGKIHWVAAGIAAFLPLAQKLFYVAIKAMPFLKYWQTKKQQTEENNQTKTTYSGPMSVKQAQEILGLDSIKSIEEISKRHKELMQKNHPDRGGSDFLAAQINQAKDTLINHLKT